MRKEDYTPSESEWQIMEIFWQRGEETLTSSEVIKLLTESSDMTAKMIRVLINRLCQKGILTYTVDEHDSRVYHYRALKSRQECEQEKSESFVNSYFSGNQTSAVATLLQNVDLTAEQIEELESILEKQRKK